MMNIATCGGARLGECPLAVQTEAGITSTIHHPPSTIQHPLPSDKDDAGDEDHNNNDDDLEDGDNNNADDCM